MTEEDILYHIRTCETQRDEYQREIKKYERQYDELNTLKSRFATLQGDFAARKQQQMAKLAAAGLKTLSLRSVRTYLESMRSLIGGSEFQKASQGLDTAAGRILQEGDRTRDRINEAEQARRKAIQNLQYWREQLRLYRAQAQEDS